MPFAGGRGRRALERYLGSRDRLGLYPGSPALIRAALRENDRLVLRAPSGGRRSTLRRRFHHDPQVEVHRRSGWEALGALLPPKEKRGLVFIDPPFEARDEFAILSGWASSAAMTGVRSRYFRRLVSG